MAGKSALLRQTALITLLAQMGCYVPADSARIGLVDRIFTRVGASDNISAGESTFMVEMTEAASILNNLTARSLVLFDELGRGTSTYDGISIAWAIVEYIHEHPSAHARTLFATHYHELNEMAQSFPRIRNYNVSVKETDGKVLFLRKLVPGGSEHSFGIHVAEMAGMPRSIVKRAGTILKEMEESGSDKSISRPNVETGQHREGLQMSFFQLEFGAIATFLYVRWVSFRIYPDYKYEGFFSMFGMLTGTASNGMILLREIDPRYQTPAANNLVLQNIPAMIMGFPVLLLLGYAPKGMNATLITLGILTALFIIATLFLFRKRKK